MTQRENLLALLRRQPHEFVPVEFMLCPSLIEDYRREEHQPDLSYEDYFQLPWRRVGDLVPDDTDLSRFEKYHDRLVFHGTIGTQTVMPFGTPEQVRAEVWKNLDIAKDGGLFVAPTHLLEPEVPWQNILAYVQACREYPLHR